MPEANSSTLTRQGIPRLMSTTKSNTSTNNLSGSGSNSNSGSSSPNSPVIESDNNLQQPPRRPSFGLNFLNNFTMRSQSDAPPQQQQLMSNSPTIANINNYIVDDDNDITSTSFHDTTEEQPPQTSSRPQPQHTSTAVSSSTINKLSSATTEKDKTDKDGQYSVRLTPLIDHSSSSSGLYFSPIIRKLKPNSNLSIGRYTEKNKAAAHAKQGSSAPVVFKSKVVSRTHALLECNEEGQWFLKDCKSSSGTFLNHIRLSPASQESLMMPIIDGDIIQLGMDYRGGTEEVYRCVKMRCEFNKSWQRKVNQFNLEIHQKFKNLHLNDESSPINTENIQNNGECAICLMKVDPCQAIFISPCSHHWHYKCIRPIIIKSYPQFYCPNCRTMCDLETDLDDDDDEDDDKDGNS
ncbi:uncharacterized protein KGF55_002760 [Candida pseudojiufengensis]|uniref:uncharacterized protein n=1 Tax=Candida pseudojiufengensis TaxID=497109 RepID=UPI002224E3A9|nr:uncharacterized protein KGF55_002760 [Candida pseudojiufengensis]KAI5962968.1 hypothetical protein KGF55_002760 [Candida pseudojiufengensis]